MALPCNNMNLNLYRVFYTVAKTKSFSESSRVLHISQPAISKHIQNLEYELNTLLFYRTNRGIELTPEATALLVYVEKAYNYLMLGERELQEGKELTKGKVSIGIQPYISIYYLNEQIKNFMKSHPNITINMSNHDELVLFELLQQHTLDLLVMPGEYKNTKDLKAIELFQVEYCFAYAKDKFSIEKSNLDSLSKEPLLLPVKNSKSRTALEKILSTQSIIVNPAMELETSEMMLSYIKDGIGIGYIPKKIAEQENLTIIELDETLPQTPITLIYSDETLTTSSREFIEELKKQEI